MGDVRDELNRLADRVDTILGAEMRDNEAVCEVSRDLRSLAARGAVPEGNVIHIPAGDKLDPIIVYFEDENPGQGRMTIACYGDAWSAWWGSMGDRTVREFVAGTDPGYLSGAMCQLRAANSMHRDYAWRVAARVISVLAAAPQPACEAKAVPLVPCLVCGGEAIKALDVLKKVTIDVRSAMPSIYDAYMTWPEDIRRKLSMHDLRRMDGWAPRPNPEGWEIDTSAGRPILVHEKCSVIEAETARYVLDLIRRDAEPAPSATADVEAWLDRDWPLWRNDPSNPNVARIRRAWDAARRLSGAQQAAKDGA